MYFLNILTDLKGILDEEQILELLEKYRSLGPLPGILLPFIESFLPFLPLFAFVFANAAAYGLWQGFLLSWIGAILGDISVFMIIRRLGNRRIFRKLLENKQVAKVTTWIGRHGFGPVFLLLCFPFSPSSVINVVSGISKINFYQYALAIILGKAVMIFSMAYVGVSIFSFAKHPTRAIVVGVCIVLLWVLGKFIEKRLQEKSLLKSSEDVTQDI
ncbi:TVP38/TMEM64 family protein [Virgibacillus soli]|uniref:TVP38/TMEM64 family protein n=1 Tax=Paracerasibacillus soli TaxID=480284 RepID=UPI0035F032F7